MTIKWKSVSRFGRTSIVEPLGARLLRRVADGEGGYREVRLNVDSILRRRRIKLKNKNRVRVRLKREF